MDVTRSMPLTSRQRRILWKICPQNALGSPNHKPLERNILAYERSARPFGYDLEKQMSDKVQNQLNRFSVEDSTGDFVCLFYENVYSFNVEMFGCVLMNIR